jgi:putative tricarboxylic transport membrane protein
MIENIATGLATAFSLANLAYCFLGVLLGTLVGVLPGLGPVPTIAMLLPITFGLEPTSSLIMLAGIFYGAQYGGSTTAILINVPGEASSVVTALDGHQMARKGQAGLALATAAISSFIAGTLATLVVAVAAPALGRVALMFSSPEYFSLMVLGLIMAVTLAGGSLLRALAMVVLGLLLGTIGTDVNSGISRFTLGFPQLYEGISFVALAMGLFGIAEILSNLEERTPRFAVTKHLHGLFPRLSDLRRMIAPALRGSAVGSALGILPGGGALLASFASYALEKRLAPEPGRFGTGELAGVAGPEAANNAGAQTSFIPMLTLGLPSNPVMALMIGAMIIHGLQPGPRIMTEQAGLFWGLIVSMWIGNLMLLVLNLPLAGLWARLLSVPYRLLFPVIVGFSCIGVYSLANSPFDVYLLALFGGVGYLLAKLGCEAAPLLLGFILGPFLEEHLRRSLLLSRGDPAIFVQRPISAVLLACVVAIMVFFLASALRRRRPDGV